MSLDRLRVEIYRAMLCVLEFNNKTKRDTSQYQMEMIFSIMLKHGKQSKSIKQYNVINKEKSTLHISQRKGF